MGRVTATLTMGLCLGAGLATVEVGNGASPVGVASSCVVPSGSWPQYLGDATHSADACSTITATNVPTLRPAWFTATTGAVSASPAVVNGSVYDGDSSGLVYSLNQATGAQQWTFNGAATAVTASGANCFLDQPNGKDEHNAGFGDITSSPTVITMGGVPTLYEGIGSSLFALNATNGHCLWAQDTDPGKAKSAIEVESSPTVDTALSPPEVLVGDDDNSSSGIAVTGLQAFNAITGALLWKYEPERDLTLTPTKFGGSAFYTLSCGDGTDDTDPALPGTTENKFCNQSNISGLPPANSTTYADAEGDVWPSAALDTAFVDPKGANSFEGSGPSGPTTTEPAGTDWTPSKITASGHASADGLVVFGTGNPATNPTPAQGLANGDYAVNDGIFAIDPVTGHRVWDFIEPYNQYDNNVDEPGGGDDDFGSSPVLAFLPPSSVPSSECAAQGSSTPLVIEGSKDGYAYGLCEATGDTVWSVEAAQAGELSPDFVGSIGGFLGSPALGVANGRQTVFFTSAIPLPLSNDGIREPGDGDTNIATCPGIGVDALPLLPACPDESLLTDPTRAVSLHAIDAATGAIVWQAPSLPTYAAASYTNGVVFFPDTTGFGVIGYDANLGVPLWAVPLGADTASEAAIVGNSIFLGTGIYEGTSIPPETTGIWSFSTSDTTPTPPASP